MKKNNSINDIVSMDLCSGCGACVNTCSNITLNQELNYNVPEVNEKCINCGRCLQVCPSTSYIDRVKNSFINKNDKHQCYISYSLDQKIRYKAASGGVISSLLIHMLEEGRIDGAICIKQSEANFLNNCITLVKSKDEVLSCMGSRYAPASVCHNLRRVLDKDKKYAIVGKPCEIEAVSKLIKSNKLYNCIIIKIAVMCAGTPGRNGTKELLHSLGEEEDTISSIKYRGEGWPGNIEIKNKDGMNKSISYMQGWNDYLAKNCSNKRCIYCDDPFGSYSDIVVGDAWGEEYTSRSDEGGFSCIISYTSAGDDLISSAVDNKKVFVEKIKYEDILRYQKFLHIKQNNLVERQFYIKLKGIKVARKELIRSCNNNYFTYLRYEIRNLKKSIE